MVNLKRLVTDNYDNGHLYKRSKISKNGEKVFNVCHSQSNLLAEPGPLGLRLKKSPSLLDLIQMRLSQGNGSPSPTTVPVETSNPRDKKSTSKDNTTSLATTEKHKASNFPAMQLRIGGWKFASRFDGDLVAKCYFAKRKLVWEILQNGLKSKIEIQWDDISALKANFSSDGSGTLFITLDKPPHFFKEINPQPRKHTLWQASSDVTDGKASIMRQHILQCPPGVLNKHYDKLIQSDTHLKFVSRHADDVNPSPFFVERLPFFKNPNAPTVQEMDKLNTAAKRSPIYALQDASSPSSSFNFEEQNSVCLTPEIVSLDAHSPSSAMDSRRSDGTSILKENGFQAQQDWDQLNALGIHKSMSMQDFVNQIDHCISEQITTGNSSCSKEALDGQKALENIAQILFSDSAVALNSDENKLMSRVNSLCCLLQDSNAGQSLDTEARLSESENQPMGMPREDSFSDLLLSLPRITSLPKFLFNITEGDDGDNRFK